MKPQRERMAGRMPDNAAALDEQLLRLRLKPDQVAGGASLHLHHWPAEIRAERSPKAVLLIAHGYAEHGLRYAKLARHFAALGYHIYAVDHWGHGRSDGRRGYVPDFSVFTAGLAAQLDHVKAQHPELPRFLLGHSMGGLIALRHLMRAQGDYQAVALSGPALAMQPQPSMVARGAARLLSRFASRLGIMKLDGKAVSRDKAEVDAYRHDPLVYRGRMSARLAHQMMVNMARAQAGAAQITLPLLIQHGGADRLTASAGSVHFMRAVGSADKQLKIYDGLYHEIYNEPEKEAVIGDLMQWFESHITDNGAENGQGEAQ